MNDPTLIERARATASAYPTDIFTEFTDDERDNWGSDEELLVTRASASMGRFLTPLIVELADKVDALEKTCMAQQLGAGHIITRERVSEKVIEAADLYFDTYGGEGRDEYAKLRNEWESLR